MTCESAVQRSSGVGAAREVQGVDAVRVRQRRPRGGTALHQVEHPRGQPRAGPEIDRQFGETRGPLAGLEHHRVARQQGRHDVAVGHVPREVEGAEHHGDAQRSEARHGLPALDRASLLRAALAVGVHAQRGLLDHLPHLEQRLPKGLPVLLAQGPRERFLLCGELEGEALKGGGAALEGGAGPSGLSPVGGVQGGGDLRGAGLPADPDRLAGRGVV